MDYTQYYCKECIWHKIDVTGQGHCYNKDNNSRDIVNGNLRACFRLKIKV